jgi:hypothetical protein
VRVCRSVALLSLVTGFLWYETNCESQEDFKQLADAFGESPQCTPDQLFSCLTAFMDAYEVRSPPLSIDIAPTSVRADASTLANPHLSLNHQRAEKDMRMKEEKAIKTSASTQALPQLNSSTELNSS